MYTYTSATSNPAIKISGKNNKILIISDSGTERFLTSNELIDGLDLEIRGNNNFIKLELPINFDNRGMIKIFNDNVRIEIGPSPFLGIALKCSLGDGQICTIAKNTVMVDVSISLEGKTELYIDEECMFSDGPIYIRPCDGHSIIDIATGNLMNAPVSPLIIGKHCWIGNSCKIIKGAQIPDNTIVGMGSLVNKIFKEEYTIIAGVPAKIIKRGRTWHKKNPYFFNASE